MSKYSKEDIFRIVEEEDWNLSVFSLPIYSANVKNVAITKNMLGKALDNRMF